VLSISKLPPLYTCNCWHLAVRYQGDATSYNSRFSFRNFTAYRLCIKSNAQIIKCLTGTHCNYIWSVHCNIELQDFVLCTVYTLMTTDHLMTEVRGRSLLVSSLQFVIPVDILIITKSENVFHYGYTYIVREIRNKLQEVVLGNTWS
jgi:hypothetical protein